MNPRHGDDLPEGWLPDPTRRHELRWWDGQRWTEHVSDDGVTSTDQPGAIPPPPAARRQDAGVGARPWRARAWWAIGLGASAWVLPVFVRASLETANPGACIRWFIVESFLLAIPALVLAGSVWGRTSRPRPKLALAAMIVAIVGILSPVGQIGARGSDPCFADGALVPHLVADSDSAT